MTIKHHTGQMTKEELKNTKIRILSEAHSKAFQEMCFKAGGTWISFSANISHLECQFLFVNSSILIAQEKDDSEFFTESSKQEIKWTPIDLTNAPEDATHFNYDNFSFLFCKKEECMDNWLKLDSKYGWVESCFEEENLCKISDFIRQEEKQMTTNIIDQIRSALPEDSEIAIAHDKINLFIDDYCFEIKSIEDIDKIQSALNTLEEYKV